MSEFKYLESMLLNIDQIEQCINHYTIDKLPKHPSESTIRQFERFRDFALKLYEWSDNYLKERWEDYVPANLPSSLKLAESDINTTNHTRLVDNGK